MTSLLIVEDDKTIAMGIEYSLRGEGFDPAVAHNAAEARRMIAARDFDLIILDVSLPDGNGFDLCTEIRAAGDTPVIFLTARDDEVNVVMGLDLGADDYITKPFRIRELVSRIRSVLRRYSQAPDGPGHVCIGPLRIATPEARVYRGDDEITLTTLEYRLLLTLVNNRGQVMSREQILDRIWDVAGNFVNDNTLSVYIKRLREKIEDDPQNPTIIQTVRGHGYRVGD